MLGHEADAVFGDGNHSHSSCKLLLRDITPEQEIYSTGLTLLPYQKFSLSSQYITLAFALTELRSCRCFLVCLQICHCPCYVSQVTTTVPNKTYSEVIFSILNSQIFRINVLPGVWNCGVNRSNSMSANESRPVEKGALPLIHPAGYGLCITAISCHSSKYTPPCNGAKHRGSH